MGMLTVVGVIALGGAADPATGRPGTEWWVTPHLLGAMLGLLLMAWSFFVEWKNIAANQRMIARRDVRGAADSHGPRIGSLKASPTAKSWA